LVDVSLRKGFHAITLVKDSLTNELHAITLVDVSLKKELITLVKEPITLVIVFQKERFSKRSGDYISKRLFKDRIDSRRFTEETM
jgi:hypothetical protein